MAGFISVIARPLIVLGNQTESLAGKPLIPTGYSTLVERGGRTPAGAVFDIPESEP
jgi:hypothetical protein